MVRFCREHRIPVAACSQHHSTYGQGLTAAGLLVETSWLNTIHPAGPEGADVDAGVLWGDTTQRRDWKLAGGLGELWGLAENRHGSTPPGSTATVPVLSPRACHN